MLGTQGILRHLQGTLSRSCSSAISSSLVVCVVVSGFPLEDSWLALASVAAVPVHRYVALEEMELG